MKKLLLPLLVLLGCNVLSPPPKRICDKVATLCELKPEDRQQCQDSVEQNTQSLGKERLGKLQECVDTSKSCAEAAGCVVGTGVSVAADGMKKFFKGFGRALEDGTRN